jgi:hypothetical protein
MEDDIYYPAKQLAAIREKQMTLLVSEILRAYIEKHKADLLQPTVPRVNNENEVKMTN